MSKTAERVAGHTERFIKKHEGHTTAQLEKMKDELSQELEELADAEEFHSFVYAELQWQYDVLEMIIRERKTGPVINSNLF